MPLSREAWRGYPDQMVFLTRNGHPAFAGTPWR